MCLSQAARASQRTRRAVYLYCWQAALVPSHPQEQLLWKIKAIQMNHDSLYPGTAASPQSRSLSWICCSKTNTFPDVKHQERKCKLLHPGSDPFLIKMWTPLKTTSSVYCWGPALGFSDTDASTAGWTFNYFTMPPVSGLVSGTWWCRKAPVTGQEPTSCHVAVPLTSLAQNTAGKHHGTLKQSH